MKGIYGMTGAYFHNYFGLPSRYPGKFTPSKDKENGTLPLFMIAALAMIVCSTFSAAQPTTSQDSRNHILILNSYHKEFQWTDNQVAGARKVLVANVEDMEIYVEYMDTKRIYTEEYLAKLVNTYHLKYDNVRLDAIITTDDNALRFVMDHHQDLFQNVPVAFCGINDYASFSFEGKDQFTGLVEVLDIEATINMALKLHPKTRKVYVIVDNTPTGIGQLADITDAAGRYENLEFEYLKGQDYSTVELLEQMEKVPKDSIALLTVWLRDKNNDYAPIDQTGPDIANRSGVPVYGIIDMYLGHGIVGGKLLNSETHGQLAAERIVRILDGEKPSSIPTVIESQNPYMFDEAQLNRWRIDLDDLPEDSIVINRTFSFYQTYRIRIWGVAGVFVFLLAVILILITNITKRKLAEQEREKLFLTVEAQNQQLRASNQQTNALNQQLEANQRQLNLKNEELQSIVYISSHDLKTPLVNINGFSQLLMEHCDEIKKLLDKCEMDTPTAKSITSLLNEEIPTDLNYITSSSKRMKRLIAGLLQISRIGTTPIKTQKIDMNDLVAEIIDTVKYKTEDLSAKITCQGLPECIGDKHQVMQVFTNLIDNALKYLSPDRKGRITVTGKTENNKSIYSVEDNGLGIKPQYHEKVFEIYHRLNPRTSSEGDGLGLTIVRRILDRHKGRIWLESQPDKGSKFFVEIPV